MSEPWDLTAVEIVERIRARELTAVDLVDALLGRVTEIEPAVLAWATLDAEGAAAESWARDEQAATGTVRPLQGVPVGVKDIIDVAGLPTIAGFEPFRERVAARDAAVVARLREAGAVIMGKTHTTQFAHGDPAPTLNPWNAERTPGGSSSGSAAAVAARMVPLAVGTQTAGSVLRPAAYCGVVGFKPGFNWVALDGVLPLAWSLDHVGLFARTVEDVALAYRAVLGTADEPLPAPPDAPRFALLPEFLERADPPVAEHLRDVAGRLRDAGATVEERPLPVDLDLLLAVLHVIMASEVAAVHAEGLAADPEHYGPNLRIAIETGQLIPAAYLVKARRLRRRIAAAVGAALADVDAFLLPTVSNEAPYRRFTGDRSFQAPWTLLGTPAITLPTGLGAENLPIGTQLVARRGGDAALLALAAWAARTLGLLAPPEVRLPEPEPVAEELVEEPAAAESAEPAGEAPGAEELPVGEAAAEAMTAEEGAAETVEPAGEPAREPEAPTAPAAGGLAAIELVAGEPGTVGETGVAPTGTAEAAEPTEPGESAEHARARDLPAEAVVDEPEPESEPEHPGAPPTTPRPGEGD
ncbi:MAG TPA: amidase family protein [Thermomicrobiaceae bacterium]|nr:amidase family protein [Thermomicrobiaceae bacterium]